VEEGAIEVKYDGPDRRVAGLSEEQIEAIATLAAKKALQEVYANVGKSVVQKVMWIVGAAVIGLLMWMGGKGISLK
jgi:hypothetical protein